MKYGVFLYIKKIQQIAQKANDHFHSVILPSFYCLYPALLMLIYNLGSSLLIL